MAEVYLVVGHDEEGAYAFAAFASKEVAERIRDSANEYAKAYPITSLEGNVFDDADTERYLDNLAKWTENHPITPYTSEPRASYASMYSNFSVTTLPVHTL